MCIRDRYKSILAIAFLLSACAPEVAPEMSTDALERGGKWCASTADCPANKTCSTEFGDCFSRPGGGNNPQITLCYGVCEADECGGCDAGEYCSECRTIDGSAFVCIPDGAAC